MLVSILRSLAVPELPGVDVDFAVFADPPRFEEVAVNRVFEGAGDFVDRDFAVLLDDRDLGHAVVEMPDFVGDVTAGFERLLDRAGHFLVGLLAVCHFGLRSSIPYYDYIVHDTVYNVKRRVETDISFLQVREARRIDG